MVSAPPPEQAGAVIAGVVVARTDLMQGTHDLGRTPSLVDTQVGDDVRHLLTLLVPATVGSEQCSAKQTSGPC